MEAFFKYRRMADQYYSYQSIHKYTDEPFTALTPDTVFNISRFLLSWLIKDEAPYGISKAYCIFAMAKQAKTLGANKLARFALEKLSLYKVPLSWQEQVDMFALSIRSRAFNDADELLPSCFRCQTINPLVNQAGDRCIACAHPMMRSFCNFELLPLVQFQPSRDVSPQDAVALIRQVPPAFTPVVEITPKLPFTCPTTIVSRPGAIRHQKGLVAVRRRPIHGNQMGLMCKRSCWGAKINPTWACSTLMTHLRRRCSTLSLQAFLHRLLPTVTCYCRWRRTTSSL